MQTVTIEKQRTTTETLTVTNATPQQTSEHDQWFVAEVQKGISEADDPNTKWVTNDQARASWEKKRAELMKRVDGSGGSV
jgi:hypothetical protein